MREEAALPFGFERENFLLSRLLLHHLRHPQSFKEGLLSDCACSFHIQGGTCKNLPFLGFIRVANASKGSMKSEDAMPKEQKWIVGYYVIRGFSKVFV